MVYALHKVKPYLLGNKFVFYVDHTASLYAVKKPQLLKQIVKWLLFLKYDFLMVYKPRSSHFMADIFLQLLDATKNLRDPNQTTNASLFVLQL
jgi:hypothetical protein